MKIRYSRYACTWRKYSVSGSGRKFVFYPGIQRIGYDLTFQPEGGGAMKKQDRLLRMIAICTELPAKLTGQVVGSDSYAAALVTKLKQEGLIAVRSGDGYRGYVLKAKGRRYVLEAYGADTAFFLRGAAGRGMVKSEVHKRIRLHRMSEVWVFLWKSGVCIFQSQKPAFGSGLWKNGVEAAAYYGSLEFKGDFEAIRGSRACGVLLSGNSAYVVYNTMEQRMKWAKKMERSMRTWTEKLLLNMGSLYAADALIFGENTGFLCELLESDGGIRKNLFQVDDIYEHYYYVPMRDEAVVQLWLLVDAAKRERLKQFLGGILSGKRDKEYAIYDGYDRHGNPVYFCHELEMRNLLRVKQEIAWKQEGMVVCLDYQKAALRAYFGEKIEIQAVITERLEEYLQQDA